MKNSWSVKRDKSKVIGFTSVVGDMLHAGHVMMLNECKQYCDYLIVGIMADPTIDRSYKNKPIQSLFERYMQVASHEAVDEVIPLSTEDDLKLAIRSLPINVRFVGEDYMGKYFTAQDDCQKLGIDIIYNKRKHNLSSTELRNRVAIAEEKKKKEDEECVPKTSKKKVVRG